MKNNMNKIKYSLGAIVATGIPVVAFAASGPTLSGVISLIIRYLNMALILMMVVAVVMFVYNVIMYYMKPDADRAAAGQYVMWSIIGFFIILSFWGLVNVLQNTFGLSNDQYAPSTWSSFGNIFPGNRGNGSLNGNSSLNTTYIPQSDNGLFGTSVGASGLNYNVQNNNTLNIGKVVNP